jgi:hypothetical protein
VLDTLPAEFDNRVKAMEVLDFNFFKDFVSLCGTSNRDIYGYHDWWAGKTNYESYL